MKAKFFLLVLLMALIGSLTGCGEKEDDDDGDNVNTTPGAATTAPATTAPATTAPDTAATTAPDAVTTASIVNTEEAFLNAISNKGTWIIAVLGDMTINQDLLLEGEFKNGKKDDAGNDVIQRKVALYSQDADRNITARYTLTAPKMTVTSPKASIQHGTFKGDLYISVSDFQLIDATVEGNVYFTTKEAQDTFAMDETSKITGTKELKQ
jgi:hypothetical protein